MQAVWTHVRSQLCMLPTPTRGRQARPTPALHPPHARPKPAPHPPHTSPHRPAAAPAAAPVVQPCRALPRTPSAEPCPTEPIFAAQCCTSNNMKVFKVCLLGSRRGEGVEAPIVN